MIANKSKVQAFGVDAGQKDRHLAVAVMVRDKLPEELGCWIAIALQLRPNLESSSFHATHLPDTETPEDSWRNDYAGCLSSQLHVFGILLTNQMQLLA